MKFLRTNVLLAVAVLLQCLAVESCESSEGKDGHGSLAGFNFGNFPEGLMEVCYSYAFYLPEAKKMKVGFFRQMFSPYDRPVKEWDVFETENAGRHITITEEGTRIEEHNDDDWADHTTAHSSVWVDSESGHAVGAAIRLTKEGLVDVGVILRPVHHTFVSTGTGHMADLLAIPNSESDSGDGPSCMSFSYGCDGVIIEGDEMSGAEHTEGLLPIMRGDEITVIVKKGFLTFQVNGTPQGDPITLPANMKVAMAVSLSQSKIRITYASRWKDRRRGS